MIRSASPRRSSRRRLRLYSMGCACLVALAGCASDPWDTPANTPPEIATLCRASAASVDAAPPEEPPGADPLELPGSADDTLEDARIARRGRDDDFLHSRMMYYQCLQENGVTLDPQQRIELERWRLRQLESTTDGDD